MEGPNIGFGARACPREQRRLRCCLEAFTCVCVYDSPVAPIIIQTAATIVFDTNLIDTNNMPPQRTKKAAIASEPVTVAPASGNPGTPERDAQQQPTITVSQKQASIDNLQLESM